jgi:hypothetical protein
LEPLTNDLFLDNFISAELFKLKILFNKKNNEEVNWFFIFKLSKSARMNLKETNFYMI